MTDIRARLADALRRNFPSSFQIQNNAGYIADVLLSLPGIAIVELPEGYDVGQGWTQFKNVVIAPDGGIRDESSSYPPVQHNAATARKHAAALLAAANAAEDRA